jgi:transposase
LAGPYRTKEGANAVSQSFNVLATPARLDPRGPLRPGVETTAREDGPPARHQLGRSDGGWLVCTSKKGGAEVGYGRKGNGTTIMLMIDGEGTPLSAVTPAANISEVHAIETLVDERVTRRPPKRLMYDKAADADWLRETLGVRGIALICPHRANRQKPPLQDGRAMRRYKRRFKVERSISWLHNCRRLITRWEYYPELFEGFVHLACLFTILKRF